MHKFRIHDTKDGRPIAGEILVRKHNFADAFREAGKYFNNQPALGITVHEGTHIEELEIADDERAWATHRATLALAQTVTLTAFQESVVVPSADWYKKGAPVVEFLLNCSGYPPR